MKKYIFSRFSIRWKDVRYKGKCTLTESEAQEAWKNEDGNTGGKGKGDKPRCDGNSPRKRQCPSKSVIWNEDMRHPFWVPGLDVEDAIKVVI